MAAADRVIRWTTAGVVVGVAAVAAVASYEHAYALVWAHGEARWTGRLVPLTVDGLIYASSMVMLDCARRKVFGRLPDGTAKLAARNIRLIETWVGAAGLAGADLGGLVQALRDSPVCVSVQ